jgi:cell division protein FtsI (penicillin-binding protein 3)
MVPGTIKVADHVFHEHDPHPTQEWSITDIVANSSNVGSIMIGQKLGKQKLDHYMRAFGFGKKTGMDFPGESAGLLLDPAKYSGTSMGTIPIGQGIAVTAVQMLAAYNTIANGGVYVAPKLVKATIDGDGERHLTPTSSPKRVVSATTAKQMTAMLAEVVRVGTATRAAIPGYTVAGKTGTARKPLENARGYKAGAYVSSFAGFVPAERPELSAIVILDEPTPIFGGLVAAPVFAQALQYGLRQYRIPPPDVPLAAAVPQTSEKAAKGVGEVGDGTTVAPNPPPNP